MKTYTPQEQEQIEDIIIKELRKSFGINQYGQGTPFWMNVLFLLRKFNQGNYYGSVLMKILGTSCQDAKEVEVTHKLKELFNDPPV